MKPLITLYAVMALLLCTPQVIAETLITVTYTHDEADEKNVVALRYEHAPRLTQVVKDAMLHTDVIANAEPQPIYWLGSALYDISTQRLFQQKQTNILNLLKTQYEDIDKPNNIKALKSLSSWVANNQFLERQFIPLDYDAIRLKNELDPLLAGKYLLALESKPQDILVLGAVAQNGPQPFVVRQGASQYLDKAQPLAHSENSFAWLIQPDGKQQKYPIAYWNQQHIDIAPGAIIYLDFDGVRDNEPALNQQILELLKHWVR
ncbi:capsule biosynthesis GfcC family protein [Shewanella sp.]|uniref:capsule biosynthesis GfcC family protein n=1 Tax=Shewanella sp. TaxID=50422 RepID=UPI0040477641